MFDDRSFQLTGEETTEVTESLSDGRNISITVVQTISKVFGS